ncbi:hypothetical protein ACLB1M_06630 [Escherichia coli]
MYVWTTFSQRKVKSLDEVRDDIAAKVKHEKALDAYYALQQKVSDAASNDTEVAGRCRASCRR